MSETEHKLGVDFQGATVNRTEGGNFQLRDSFYEAKNFHSPSFLVSSNGFVSPIPSGAVGPKRTVSPGVMFDGGSGGWGFDKRTSGVRVMYETSNHPGRTVYMDKQQHIVDPQTGKQNQTKGHINHGK